VVNCLEQYCAPLGELSARKVFGILTVVRIRHFGPDEQNVMHGKDFMQATGDVCQPLLAKMRKLNFDYKEQVAQDLCNCMQQAQQPALESEEEPAPKRVLADYRRCARQHWLVARYLASYDYALEKIEGSMAAEACPQVMKLLKRAREATTEAAQE
jgi:hypothetical protein